MSSTSLARRTAAVMATGALALTLGVTPATPATAATAAAAAPTVPAVPAPAGPTATAAAGLLTDLVALFSEHVYLSGEVVTAGLTAGTNSPLYAAAVTALDDNNHSLAAAITSGSQDPTAYYQALTATGKAEAVLSLDFASGRPSDATLAKHAAEVEQGDLSLAKLGVQSLQGVTLDQLTLAHKTLSTTIVQAGSAVTSGAKDAFVLTELAAVRSSDQASAYAAGIAAKKGLTGVDSRAAVLRAALTLLFVGHVYQTGILTHTALLKGPRSPQARAASLAEDANSQALAKSIEQLFGSAAGGQFLADWRAHIGGYKTFVMAKVSRNATQRARAIKGLNGYVGDAAAQFHGLLPNLGTTKLTQDLSTHIAGTEKQIDLQAAMSVGQFANARAGAKHFADVAATLAATIVAKKGITGTVTPAAASRLVAGFSRS